MPINSSTPRYEALNSDETRLPTGMERVGYDEQTSTYTYLDRTDGSYWEDEKGNRYGELHRLGRPGAPRRNDAPTYQQSENSCHYFLPLAVIICTVLATFFWFVGVGKKASTPGCQDGWERYMPRVGDTCWKIAEHRGINVAELVQGNEGLVCEELRAGWPICAPVRRQGSE